MKLETIKKDNKKKIIIGSMIVLSVVGCLTLTTTRAKYRNIQSLKLASGTVNYKAPDLNLVAINISEDGVNYTKGDLVPTTGYTLNTTLSKCRVPTSTLTGENAPVDNEASIEYKDGKVYIGINKKNTKCYIYFDKMQGQTSSTIIANIKTRTDGSYKGDIVPIFTDVATGTETEANNGIYETNDPMYGTNAKTYYWRGAATTNHVIFDNKCWRIVRINGDGSIRLIYNGETQSGNVCKGNGSNAGSAVLKGTFYDSARDSNSSVGWSYTIGSQRPSTNVPQTSGTRANARIKLEDTWYIDNISSVEEKKITYGKFCNDRSTENNSTWVAASSDQDQNYAVYSRLTSGTKTPMLSCPNGDIYSLKVGLISGDEVQFAGASGGTSNTSYYLYNGEHYWTMSPAYWNSHYGCARAMSVSAYGGISSGLGRDLSYATLGSDYMYIRPVINLRSDVTFNAGSDGTQDNPYIVQ